MNKTQQKKSVQTAKLWTGAILAAFVASIAIYFVLLQVEKNALAQGERRQVWLAAEEIPEGEVIRPEHLGRYFKELSVEAQAAAQTALQNPEQMIGKAAICRIEKGVLLTDGMFRDPETVPENLEHPVIAGFRAEDLFQVVGGVLRAGDRIHIYSAEEDLGTFLIWENVYVQQVFDAAGAVIESTDRTTAAQRINIFLDKEDVEQFYTRLERGSLRVVRDWRQEDV